MTEFDRIVEATNFLDLIVALSGVAGMILAVLVFRVGIYMVLRIVRSPSNETEAEFKARCKREHGWDL